MSENISTPGQAAPASPVPEFQPVSSSNIAGLCHDGKDLFVKFHNGAVWQYHDVPAEKHTEMLASGSVGSFLHSSIKPHHAATRRD